MDRTMEPYVRGLRGWRDVTRDASHPPHVVQFRIDLRSVALWLADKLHRGAGKFAGSALAFSLRAAFRVWELIFLTIVLQIGMCPLMALDFHRVTLLGALANLLAVPLTGILVPAGFVVLLVGTVSHFIAAWIALPVQFLTQSLIQSVAWFSQLPHGSYRVPGPPLWLTLLFFACAGCLCIFLRLNFARNRVLLAVSAASLLLATILIAVHPFAPYFEKGNLELTVLDVGQGDSLFLSSPAGHTLLIDAGGQPPTYAGQTAQRGPDPGEEAVSPYLWSRGLKKIDVVALTHAHQDHIGGLTAVLENFQIGELWIGRKVQTPALENLLKLACSRGIPVRIETRGQAFTWDGIRAEVLWPEPGSNDISTSAKNNDSLVLRLQFRNRSFFLPGDAEFQAESAILSENASAALQSDLLKVGHHGSKNSTTPELLAAVNPQWAIISSGAENPYGHPSPELMQRLRDAKVKILRTDQNGAIHILSNGDNLEITCFLDCSQAVSANYSVSAQPPNHQQTN
jgi:competence protein ComEC